MNPLRILLLGAPGSGKGTQTSRLLKRFTQLQSLSSGDILRNQIRLGSAIGGEAQTYIKNESLVPDTNGWSYYCRVGKEKVVNPNF